MKESIPTLRKSLNKAFLKVKPDREGIECFKSNLKQLLDAIKPSETEEYHKNLVIRFLKNTWFGESWFINTKERTDLRNPKRWCRGDAYEKTL